MTDPVNVLKPYLFEALPEKFEVNEGEQLVDALVVVRIQALSDDGSQVVERYEYTVSKGLGFAAARGMIECIRDELRDVNTSYFGSDDDDDEGVGT